MKIPYAICGVSSLLRIQRLGLCCDPSLHAAVYEENQKTNENFEVEVAGGKISVVY